MRVAYAGLCVVLLSPAASGCSAKEAEATLPVIEFKDSSAEKVLDYFFDDAMPWDEEIEFSLAEFPDAAFWWTSASVSADEGGETLCLFWGMPVWSVYLADLNGDGMREICSTLSMGSGIIDDRIAVYDYANKQLYQLEGRFECSYFLELEDGVLMCRKAGLSYDSEPGIFSEPLGLDKMVKVPVMEI